MNVYFAEECHGRWVVYVVELGEENRLLAVFPNAVRFTRAEAVKLARPERCWCTDAEAGDDRWEIRADADIKAAKAATGRAIAYHEQFLKECEDLKLASRR